MYESCVVYKFTCPCDQNNQYIGETERQLLVRIKEHITTTNSEVFIENCSYYKHFCNIYNCFEVTEICETYNYLLSTEALLIKKLQLNLNNQLGPDKGSRIIIISFF